MGSVAIGQIALGRVVLAQFGLGGSVWSVARKDPEAIEFFTSVWNSVRM